MRRQRLLVALTTVFATSLGVVSATAADAAERQIDRGPSVGSDVSTVRTLDVAEASSEAAVATKVVFTRRSSRVIYGSYAVLEGQVQTDSSAVANVVVKLYARPAGSTTWSYLTYDTTDATNGLFHFDRKPFKNTDYQVVFEGNVNYSASSVTGRIEVRRNVSSTMTKRTDGKFRFYGSVAPSYKSKRIGLQRKKCTGCSWSTIGSTYTSSESRWAFTLSGPGYPTTWYYRSFAPNDSSYAVGYSDEWKITRY